MKRKKFSACRFAVLLFVFRLLSLSAAGQTAPCPLLRNARQLVTKAEAKERLFKGAVLSTSSKFNKDCGKNDGALSFRHDDGLRLNFRDAVIFLGAGLPLQTVDQFKEELEGGFSAVKSQSVVRWGIQAESPEKFPFRAKAAAGTLAFSHSLSLLKNPLLSGGSSLRGISLSKGDIGCSLPSLSSAQKEKSVFACVEGESGVFSSQVCAMYSRDGSYALSATLPLSFAKGCLLELGLSGGMFLHGREGSSAWFSKTLPYKEKNYGAACSVLNLKLPFLKSSSVFGVNQNPYGGFCRWFRTGDEVDLASSLGLTSFSGGFFLADGGLVSSGGTLVEVERQFFGCASHAFYVKDSLLRTGASFRRSLHGEGSSSGRRENDLLRADFSFSRGRGNLSAYASGEFDDAKDSVYRAGLSWRQNFDSVRSSLSLSARRSAEKDSLSVKLFVRPQISSDSVSLSLGSGVNGNIMEGKFKADKVDSSLAVVFKGRFLSVNAKVSFSCDVQ